MSRKWTPRGRMGALLGLLAVLAGGEACDTTNVGSKSGDFFQLTCMNDGPDWEVFEFGDVELGRAEQLSFDAFNGSELVIFLTQDDWDVIQLESTIRLSGFDVTECSSGDPGSFSVKGPFPVDLAEGDEQAFSVEFAPLNAGEHRCTLEPQYEVIRRPDPKGYTIDKTMDRCTVAAVGIGIPGPGPVCALAPPSALVDFGEVETGGESWQSLTIRNETPNVVPANRFFFAFDNPTNDCILFSMSPDDSSGVVGPAGAKQVPVRFAPGSEGTFQCVRSLSTVSEPGGSEIASPCPGIVTWAGTAVAPPLSWSACSSPTVTQDLNAVTGLSANEVFVAGDGGTVLTSSGDCRWQHAGTGFADVNLRGLWVYAEGGQKSLWAVGNIPPPQGLYQETGVALHADGPDPAGWTKIDEDGLLTFQTVWGSGLNDVYFAGLGVSSDFPNAKHFTGDPQNLEELIISMFGMSEVTGLSGTAADDLWAVLRQSLNAVYRFGGGSPSDPWEDMTPSYAPLSPLNDVWAGKGDGWEAVYAVGDAGAIYHFDGQEWLPDESIKGEARDFHGVWVSPVGKVFVVGEGPVIYQGHVDSPRQWTLQALPAMGVEAGDVLLDVWGTGDDNVYVVGTNGVILRYAPEGAVREVSR